MKCLLTSSLALVLFAGCATAPIYNNDICDASSTFAISKISEIQTTNPLFRLYNVNGNCGILINEKLNGEAVKPDSRSLYDRIAFLNRLMILDKKQLADLKATCKAIVEYNPSTQDEGDVIIQYKLTDNNKWTKDLVIGDEEVPSSNYAYHEVLFTIQFISSKNQKGNVRTQLSYKKFTMTKPQPLSKDTIAKLLADLEQGNFK